MHDGAFMEAIAEIYKKDPRYDAATYLFVRDALDFTVKTLERPATGRGKHVSGQELLEGIRKYALREYGPMTLTVFKRWGVTRTEDFGEIVFNLVESGKLGRTEEDKREDFADGYDFFEAFGKPFLPARPPAARQTKKKAKSAKGSKQTSKRKEENDG
jgi:uncharacterized repeat protein (TIGR04138 family)